jgi:hypothetical protein
LAHSVAFNPPRRGLLIGAKADNNAAVPSGSMCPPRFLRGRMRSLNSRDAFALLPLGIAWRSLSLLLLAERRKNAGPSFKISRAGGGVPTGPP